MANEPWRDFLGIYVCNLIPIGGAFLIPTIWPLLFATFALDCLFLVVQILAWKNEIRAGDGTGLLNIPAA